MDNELPPESMTSSQPYLIRGIYDWIIDNAMTPYLLVNAENDMKANMMNGQFAQELTKLNAMNEQQAIVASANQQQQVRLANLANLQQAGLTQAQLTQQMSLANLNANQQTSLANAQTIAGMDVLNLNNAQQTAISNSNLFRTFEVTACCWLFKFKTSIPAIVLAFAKATA